MKRLLLTLAMVAAPLIGIIPPANAETEVIQGQIISTNTFEISTAISAVQVRLRETIPPNADNESALNAFL